MKEINTKHGTLQFPLFLPDATYGAVRTLSFNDLRTIGIEAIVTTTLHIEQKIGSEFIREYGGIHKFFNWNKPILTDSGGWQVYSLITSTTRGNKKNKITDVGATFIDVNTGKSTLLTPETSIHIQLNLSSDILTVLDNPIEVNASLADQKKSITLNTSWAKRAKKYFQNKTQDKNILLGSVVQGGDNFELRKISAQELIEIGFDLYNFGGLPMNYQDPMWRVRVQSENKVTFFREMLEYVANLLPKDSVKYAMGVGKPVDIAFCVDVGWDMFDTVLPTRNARHGLLYVSEGQGDETISYKSRSKKTLTYDHLHLKSQRYKNDTEPVDKNCNCECCQNVSRAYLRHLLRISEPSGYRLATIHNLTFYNKWIKMLRDIQNNK